MEHSSGIIEDDIVAVMMRIARKAQEGESEEGDDDTWHIGKPRIRIWELDENSTRYDAIAAAPSDDFLHRSWRSWAVVATLVGIFSLTLFLAIAINRKARRNPFNLYLLYLSIPDFIFSFCCGITCTLNALEREYWSGWMCNFQQWYMIFGIGANAWLNACVTRELYHMLSFGNRRRRYTAPSRLTVTKQALGVYLWMGILATLGVIDAPNWPLHTGATSGLYCVPMEVDKASSYFFWLAWFPFFAGIPSIFIIVRTIQIFRQRLLPPSGKRRLLAIYFGRLILVFYLIWLPTLMIMFAFTTFVPPVMHYAAGLLAHLQGAISAGLCLLKPDILHAYQNLIFCRCCSQEQREGISHDTHNNNDNDTRRRPPGSSSQPQDLENRTDSSVDDMNLSSDRNLGHHHKKQERENGKSRRRRRRLSSDDSITPSVYWTGSLLDVLSRSFRSVWEGSKRDVQSTQLPPCSQNTALMMISNASDKEDDDDDDDNNNSKDESHDVLIKNHNGNLSTRTENKKENSEDSSPARRASSEFQSMELIFQLNDLPDNSVTDQDGVGCNQKNYSGRNNSSKCSDLESIDELSEQDLEEDDDDDHWS